MNVYSDRFIASAVESDEAGGLVCPVCGSSRLRVIMTRPRAGSSLRRRQCKPCDFRFFTTEVVTDGWGNPVGPTIDEALMVRESA